MLNHHRENENVISVQAIFVLVLISYFQLGPDQPLIFSPEIAVLSLVLVLSFVSLSLAAVRGFVLNQKQIVFFVLLCTFFIWGLITVIAKSGHLMDSAFRRLFLGVGISILIFSSISVLSCNKDLSRKLSIIFIIVATFVSVTGIAMSFFGGGYEGFKGDLAYQSFTISSLTLTQEVHFVGGFPRISSITSNPNTFGFYSGLACLMCLVLLLSKGMGISTFLVLFIVNAVALIHSYSRGAILAFLITFIFIVAIYNWKKLFIVILVFSLVGIAGVVAFSSDIADVLKARQELGLQGRDIIWENSFGTFSEEPLVGVGFGLEVEKVHEPAGIKWTMHNAFLVILVETGLIGFAIFLALLSAAFIFIYQNLIQAVSEEEKIEIILSFSVCLFIVLRCLVETSVMRFTPINFIFFTYIALGLRTLKYKKY